MKQKKALAFWYNLKGCYDIVVFDNLRNLKKFKKEYAELYEAFENEQITFDEFGFNAENLFCFFEGNILKVIYEVYSKDIEIEEDKYFFDYIDNEEIKIIVDDKLEYGY